MAGIYLHIPFCKQACTYCNFHFSTSLKMKDELLQALLKELELQSKYLAGQSIETVYFGGGTPSLLSAEEVMRVFGQVERYYNLGQLQEVTLEANPDDLTKQYLRELKQTPVSRFSVGVQSFKEQDLLYMNRAHNAQEADYAIKAAQDAGFDNLSIDLIYGTPGLSDADWLYNLRQVKALAVPHFSAYALTVEEGTALHHSIAKRKAAPVDNEQAAGQFEMLMEQAEAMGYEHYEISNLSLPGRYAVHNTNYWRGKPYLGIGPSAHSFDGQNGRQWNVANNALYIKSILADGKVPFEEEVLTPLEHLNEYIMTSLRTMWGCDLQRISNEWGERYTGQILEDAAPFIDEGKLLHTEGKLLLTHKGKLFADRIAGELFV
jgi:oxygen-independent coproporphyrinogen III oxidase